MSTQQEQQRQQQQQKRRTTASVVTRVATTAMITYGAYHIAQWYWNKVNREAEEQEKDVQQSSEARRGPMKDKPMQDASVDPSVPSTAPPPPLSTSSTSFSWLSVATDWAMDAAMSALSSNTIPTKIIHQCPPQKQAPTVIRPFPPPAIATGTYRRKRLMQCREKTGTAFCACWPALQPILEELTSTSHATRHLKELRKHQKDLMLMLQAKEGTRDGTDSIQRHQQLKRLQQQQDELWKQIVVENITRMMASSYSYTFLYLSLTVQLHWISGNRESWLRDSAIASCHHSSSTELVQAMLMQSYQYFMDVGIPLLVSTIRRSVEAILTNTITDTDIDWTKPTQFLTQQDIENILYQKLPRTFKYGSASTGDANATCTQPIGISRNLVRFVLPDEQFFDPIWDICSSPVWDDAQDQIFEVLWYNILRDADVDGWKQLFEHKFDPVPLQVATSAPGLLVGRQQQQEQQPVAKVVAQFKKSTNLLFAKLPKERNEGQPESSTRKDSTILSSLQNLPTVLELGDVSFQAHHLR
jgi:hypothetical protein